MKANVFFTFVLCLSFSNLNFAKSRIEVAIDRLIVSHKEIKEYDSKLNDCYRRLLDLLCPEEKEKLKQEQILWLKERNVHVSNPSLIENKYKERIDELMSLFNRKALNLVITDQPTINMLDPMINKALHYCDLDVCKLYSLFFDYANSDKASNNIEAIKAQLATIASEMFSDPYDLKRFCEFLGNNIDSDFLRLLTLPDHQFSKWADQEDLIPLWFVFQNKNILEYLDERRALSIKSSHSVRNLSAFKLMSALMGEMAHGRWVATSYYSQKGSIFLDLAAHEINFIDKLSYAPERIRPAWLRSVEFNMMPLKAWSLEGIWNRLLFKKFEAAFIEASHELENYYKTSYNLQDYADQATLLLSSYVYHNFPLPGISSCEAFQV